jgi:hypothetical protein
VPLDAGMAYIQSPADDVSSEAGLDHVAWAEGISRRLSIAVRSAYVEAEFFAGTGNQAAVGLEGGMVRFGPLRTQMPTEDREGFEVVQEQDVMAINLALRWLGVVRSDLRDEFDTVGLGRVRGDWEPHRFGWD